MKPHPFQAAVRGAAAIALLPALLAAVPVAAQETPGGQGPAAAAAEQPKTSVSRSIKIYSDTPGTAAATPAPIVPAVRLDVLNSSIKVENSAGVSVDLIPDLEINAGSKVGFRITTRKSGYLILLDVDASGRLTQIFPNTTMVGRSGREASNLIKPGRPLTIPQLGSPYAGFEFVAEPPAGVAMVVALLSDKPVQVVDLPNAPPPAAAPGDTLKYVRDQTRSLKVPNDNGQLEQPNWSFDGKFYLIK